MTSAVSGVSRTYGPVRAGSASGDALALNDDGVTPTMVYADRTSQVRAVDLSWVAEAPVDIVNDTAPSITGAPRVGVALTASTGTWTPSGNYTYQWLAGGIAIPGATTATYTPSPADVTKQLTVAVTAAKAGFNSATSTSAPTAPVQPGTLQNTQAPTISGIARVGLPLQVSSGAWSPAPTGYSYQWFAGGAAVSGATGATYTPTAAVLGKVLTVRVTAIRNGYTTTQVATLPSHTVLAGTISSTRPPTITGVKKVGRTLTATPGGWSVAGLTLRYQWLRDGRSIPGARSRTYKLPAATRGHRISVRVTASRVGYNTSMRTSAQTVKIG